MKSQRSESSKWAKTINICILKANVKKSPSMWHRYHSAMHLHRNDSRNRFSAGKKKRERKRPSLECNTSHTVTCANSTCSHASLRLSCSPYEMQSPKYPEYRLWELSGWWHAKETGLMQMEICGVRWKQNNMDAHDTRNVVAFSLFTAPKPVHSVVIVWSHVTCRVDIVM